MQYKYEVGFFSNKIFIENRLFDMIDEGCWSFKYLGKISLTAIIVIASMWTVQTLGVK